MISHPSAQLLETVLSGNGKRKELSKQELSTVPRHVLRSSNKLLLH